MIMMASLALAISSGTGLAFAGNKAVQIIRIQVIHNQTIGPLDVKTIMNSRGTSSLPKDPNASTLFPYRAPDEHEYKVSVTSQVDHEHGEIVTLTLTDSK